MSGCPRSSSVEEWSGHRANLGALAKMGYGFRSRGCVPPLFFALLNLRAALLTRGAPDPHPPSTLTPCSSLGLLQGVRVEGICGVEDGGALRWLNHRPERAGGRGSDYRSTR